MAKMMDFLFGDAAGQVFMGVFMLFYMCNFGCVLSWLLFPTDPYFGDVVTQRDVIGLAIDEGARHTGLPIVVVGGLFLVVLCGCALFDRKST